MQLTDRRIYFTWEDSRRRDVPFFEEEANELEHSSTSASAGAATLDGPWVVNLLSQAFPSEYAICFSDSHRLSRSLDPREPTAVGCIDFSLLPES